MSNAAEFYLALVALHGGVERCYVMPQTMTRHSTVGDCVFTVAGPQAWNSLPSDIHR